MTAMNSMRDELDDKSLITVIMPTFRRPKLLKRAIDSVLAQSYPQFRVCVYDNASLDETAKVVEEYTEIDKRVQYHAHAENIGSNNNFLFGLVNVNTPFFVFLSDDDFFMPTFLEEAMKGFARHPEAGIFIGGLIVIDEKHKVKGFDLYEWAEKEYFCPKELIAKLVAGCPIPYIAAMVFRTDVREKAGLLKPHIIWHDVEFLMRAFKLFSVIVCNIPCAVFFVHSTNISLSISVDEFLQLRLCYVNMLEGVFSSDERTQLMDALDREARKEIFSFSLQKWALGRFDESLRGVDILKQRYGVNKKEIILKALSLICLKSKKIGKLLRALLYVRRAVARVLIGKKLKKKISKNCFKQFASLIRH